MHTRHRNRVAVMVAAVIATAGAVVVPAAAAPTATSATTINFPVGLRMDVDRGRNGQVIVTAHRMASNGGIKYPWSFDVKAKVGNKVVRTSMDASWDGGEAGHQFPPNTTWVAVRDQMSGWKRKTPPPRDPNVRYYPGAYFLNVNENGEPSRWNPCQTYTWAAHGPSATARNKALLRQTFAYASKATGIVFRESQDPSVRASVNVTMTWRGGISYGGADDSIPVDPLDPDTAWIITRGMMEMNLSRSHSVHVRRALMIHELGHVLNMDHNPQQNAVMHVPATDQSPLTFTKADRKTLKHLDKSQGCLTPATN